MGGNTVDQTELSHKSNGFFSTEPSDKDLFEEALSLLSNQEQEPQYNEARVILEKLVQQFPKSKWVAGAKAMIVSLNNISALEAQLNQEKHKQNKLTQEIAGLRDKGKQAEEKHLAEIFRLQQENDELKKDIQQLKNLEIQLEKRTKKRR
ncbi:MAG: hypothetical protein ACYDGO_09825 [Smithellaceae bacterium]